MRLETHITHGVRYIERGRSPIYLGHHPDTFFTTLLEAARDHHREATDHFSKQRWSEIIKELSS